MKWNDDSIWRWFQNIWVNMICLFDAFKIIIISIIILALIFIITESTNYLPIENPKDAEITNKQIEQSTSKNEQYKIAKDIVIFKNDEGKPIIFVKKKYLKNVKYGYDKTIGTIRF